MRAIATVILLAVTLSIGLLAILLVVLSPIIERASEALSHAN